jgi:hypothetical protein
MARRYRFLFRGTGEVAGDLRTVESQGNTRPSAERLARARLRDQTRRDSSLWTTQRCEFVTEDTRR